MADAAEIWADIIAIAALGLSGYALVQGKVRSSQDKKRRRAIVPSDDLRAALVDIRGIFVEIVSLGGQRSNYFMDQDRQSAGRRIKDLEGRPDDVELSTLLGRVIAAWDEAFANAPPLRSEMIFSAVIVITGYRTVVLPRPPFGLVTGYVA